MLLPKGLWTALDQCTLLNFNIKIHHTFTMNIFHLSFPCFTVCFIVNNSVCLISNMQKEGENITPFSLCFKVVHTTNVI